MPFLLQGPCTSPQIVEGLKILPCPAYVLLEKLVAMGSNDPPALFGQANTCRAVAVESVGINGEEKDLDGLNQSVGIRKKGQ